MIYLVQYLNVVICKVEEDEAAQAAEGALLHGSDVTALQREVRQVGGVLERPCGQRLNVIPSQVKLHCDLVVMGKITKVQVRNSTETEKMYEFKRLVS